MIHQTEHSEAAAGQFVLRPELHQFNPDYFGAVSDLFADPDSDDRNTLIVACADHGTAPDQVSFTGPERLFIIQHQAGTVPASGDSVGVSTMAALEYAICCLPVRRAIVCSHTGCRIIANWLKPGRRSSHNDEYRTFECDVRHFVDASYSDVSGSDRFQLMIREHVLVQLEHLQSHSFVAARLRDGSLKLHGWIVDDETARVQQYDPVTGQYTCIEKC